MVGRNKEWRIESRSTKSGCICEILPQAICTWTPWVPSNNHAESTSNRNYWGEQKLGYLSSTALLCANSKHFWPGLLLRWTHSGGGSTLRRVVSADCPHAGLSSPPLVPVGRVWQRRVLSDGLALKVFCDSLKTSSAATSNTNVVCYLLGSPSEPYQWVALSTFLLSNFCKLCSFSKLGKVYWTVLRIPWRLGNIGILKLYKWLV